MRTAKPLFLKIAPGAFAVMFFIISSASCPAAEDIISAKESILETITVTSQKREENVQEVTSSITVISDVNIEDAGIVSTRDIWKHVPNMTTLKSGSRDYFTRINVRGISNSAFGDPGVALYIDDVSYAGVYAFDSALFDIERIEILKGPQGTLYGKNTEGGAISIVTKSPGNDFGAKIGLEAGNYDSRKISAMINAPIVKDKLFMRMAALKSSHDGYIENVYRGGDIDNQDTLLGNLSLLFKPSRTLSFDLKLRMSDFDDDGGFPAAPLDRDMYETATGYSLGDFESAFNYKGKSSSESQTFALKVSKEFGSFDIISVTAYREMDNSSTLDADFTQSALYLGFNEVETDSVTQELRIQSNDEDESFKWLFGLYYGDDDNDYGTGYMLDTDYAAMMGMPVYTTDRHSAATWAKDMAVFGQSSVRFFDKAFGLTAGLRYERSERGLDHSHTFAGTASAAPINDMEETYSELMPKLALDYFINENTMAYASIARGYKAGGFAYAVDDPELAGFDPETSTAYEVGLKTEFPRYRLRINLAAFYTEIDDYQDRVQFDPMTVIQANVTETDIYGFEAEAAWGITETVSLNGFFGYTNAEYGKYIDPLTSENYKGNDVSLIPEYDFGVFAEYRDDKGFFARAEMQGTGSYYFDRGNTEEQSAYILYNTKIGYEQEKWDVYLALENITDKHYFLDAWSNSGTGYMGTVGDPRTVSLAFNYRF